MKNKIKLKNRTWNWILVIHGTKTKLRFFLKLKNRDWNQPLIDNESPVQVPATNKNMIQTLISWARMNQHPIMHQLWMRLFWPFWDEPKPFNLNQTKHWGGFFFSFHWPTFPEISKNSPLLFPPLPSSSLLFFLSSSPLCSFFLLFHCSSFFFINFFSSFSYCYCYYYFSFSFVCAIDYFSYHFFFHFCCYFSFFFIFSFFAFLCCYNFFYHFFLFFFSFSLFKHFLFFITLFYLLPLLHHD